MFRPRLIPVLTLKGKGLVKTIRFNKTNARYIGDPINAVRIFNDLEADELIFLDITATLEGRCIAIDLVRTIGEEAYMPFAVGGGISNMEQVKALIAAGAEKLVFNTCAITNPELIRQAAGLIGNQSVIVCIDVKKNLWGRQKACSWGGKKMIDEPITELAQRMADLGAGELIIQSIDRDGTQSGYDIELIGLVSNSVAIPVVACGGAANLSDFRQAVDQGGAAAVAAGSMFVYHGLRNAVLVNYPSKAEINSIFA